MWLQVTVRWLDAILVEPVRHARWSYLPPLMVYLAAGISGLTAIVGTFFVKDYLGLSAAFLAGLSFWAGIPWALKMPLGHLVDLIWRWKAWLVYVGAALIALSIAIMYALIAHTDQMAAVMSVAAWFVLATVLAPVGYVVQDVVADAMTVEAVPTVDVDGRPYADADVKAMHTTMQMLGRFAIIGGLVAVASLDVAMFADVETLGEAEKTAVYARYLLALIIPLISVVGVILGGILLRLRARQLRQSGMAEARIQSLLFAPGEETEPNWWIFGGGLAFVVFTLAVGLGDVPLAQEIIFTGSMAIVVFLMSRLLLELDRDARRALIGTAVIIFIFRAVPLPGPGATWFEIDVLGFDQRFLAVLSLITSCLTLVGMLVLRPLMARRSIAYIVVMLTVAAGVLALPNIGLYYGIHQWTAQWTTAGIVDARFIAIIDTALESPLGQIAMIPLLAWIAKNAPAHLKATFFAVMASFTNLALSAASLGTKYLNQIFVVSREVRDRTTGTVTTAADYSELGLLLITVALIGVLAPLATVWLIQSSRLHTEQ